MRDFFYKIVSQKLRRFISVWLKPGNQFFCQRLTSLYGSSTFSRIMRIIVDDPDSVFLTQNLVAAVNPFIMFQTIGTNFKINSNLIGDCDCCSRVFRRMSPNGVHIHGLTKHSERQIKTILAKICHAVASVFIFKTEITLQIRRQCFSQCI
ncbi:hypothetical protein SDC9_185813 [bioreactor metagenome]|uniref:Uncharacterized protein n=1 Tax=bioreactor metagenome TaxID=1076179 RepID=A0A645HJB4_9ZZZZ